MIYSEGGYIDIDMENMQKDDVLILQDIKLNIIYIFSGVINSDLLPLNIYICILYGYTNMMLRSKDKMQKIRVVLHDCRVLPLNIHVQLITIFPLHIDRHQVVYILSLGWSYTDP